jgi:uncharacterized cupredoxin-like copper-binding protein
MTSPRLAATRRGRRFAGAGLGLLAAGLLLGAGCSAVTPTASSTGSGSVRVVTIELADFRFVPAVVDVGVGESVRFIVVNRSDLPHELFIGTAEDQQRHHALHAAAPPEMQDRLDEGATGIYVPGRGTGQLVYRVDRPGDLVIGCHLIGHFEAGMVGLIRVIAAP